MRILFVCTGNTCRSPMAAYLARNVAQRRGLDWEVDSAGLYALPGLPMSEPAVTVLGRRGITGADGHAAKPVTPELVRNADLILAMTASHARELREQFPEAAGKVHVLGEFVREEEACGPADLRDPFGGTDEDYEACAAALEQWLERLADRLACEETAEQGRDPNASGDCERSRGVSPEGGTEADA
jgi:protein-tyrosine-phosphatase